jgi:hypothetical protein
MVMMVMTHSQRMLPGLHQRPCLLDRAVDDRVQVDDAHLQVNQAFGHPRHVQQVVDQYAQMPGLARNHFGSLDHPGIPLGNEFEHLCSTRDRCQRVAQFMCKHGEKLVLAVVHGHQLALTCAQGPERPDRLGDVAAFDEDASDLSPVVEGRLVNEAHEALLERTVRFALQHDRQLIANVRLAGCIDLV